MTTASVIEPIRMRLLQTVFCSQHVSAISKGQETHDPALRLMAQLAPFIADDNHLVDIVSAAFPPGYNGNTITELPKMIADARKKGFDQPKLPGEDKQKQSLILTNLLLQDRISFFKDHRNRGYMSVPTAAGGRLHYSLSSEAAELYIQRRFYHHTQKPMAAEGCKEVLNLFRATALFDSEKCQTALRVGRSGDAIYIDLGREDALVVKIDKDGWATTYDCPVKFIRTTGLGELPVPVTGGALTDLQDLLQLADGSFRLVLAFLLVCLRPGPTYMCLLVEGEQGSGKSFLCETIKRIIDPHVALKLRAPENERDLMVVAQATYLLVYDNASGIKNSLSDALCVIATGGGLGVRKLHTDEDTIYIDVSRPFIMNGIGEFAHRPDLLDRSIPLKLPALPQEGRRTEEALRAQFEAILPGLLGALYHIVACALRNEATAAAPAGFRMADAVKWLAAAEAATGLSASEMLADLQAAQDELVLDRVLSNPVSEKLVQALYEGPIEDTVGALLTFWSTEDVRGLRHFPKTASQLSKELTRLKPGLAKADIFLDFLPRRKEGKFVRAWRSGQEGREFRKLMKF